MKGKKKFLASVLAMIMAMSVCFTSFASDGNTGNNKYQTYYDAIEMLNDKYDAHMQIEDESVLDNFSVEEFIEAVEESYKDVEDIDKGIMSYEIVPTAQPTISPRSTSIQYCYLKGTKTDYGKLGLQTLVNDSMQRYSTVQSVWSEDNGYNTYFVTQRHSQSFSADYMKCNVAYTGHYYNKLTGVVLTVLKTYNITYTCRGGNLIMNVGNVV